MSFSMHNTEATRLSVQVSKVNSRLRALRAAAKWFISRTRKRAKRNA
jgi:hypothetical protein